jgi:hypothetical protein
MAAGPRYVALARTAQKTALPKVTPLLLVTQPLPSNGCFSGSTVPSLSECATVIYPTVSKSWIWAWTGTPREVLRAQHWEHRGATPGHKHPNGLASFPNSLLEEQGNCWGWAGCRHLKGQQFKLGPVSSPPPHTHTHTLAYSLWDCEVFAELKCHHTALHFMIQSDCVNRALSKIVRFIVSMDFWRGNVQNRHVQYNHECHQDSFLGGSQKICLYLN